MLPLCWITSAISAAVFPIFPTEMDSTWAALCLGRGASILERSVPLCLAAGSRGTRFNGGGGSSIRPLMVQIRVCLLGERSMPSMRSSARAVFTSFSNTSAPSSFDVLAAAASSFVCIRLNAPRRASRETCKYRVCQVIAQGDGIIKTTRRNWAYGSRHTKT